MNFKGVTYETLSSEVFSKKAREHFPDLKIFDEFDAAQET
jgi:hypothetical protein